MKLWVWGSSPVGPLSLYEVEEDQEVFSHLALGTVVQGYGEMVHGIYKLGRRAATSPALVPSWS